MKNVKNETTGEETGGFGRAVIYIRVSTAGQANRHGAAEGYSLPIQRESCQRKAQDIGAVVVDEYIDQDSASSTKQRPAFQRLVARVREDRDIDFVIVYKLDRYARSILDDALMTAQLEAAGATLVSCLENVDATAPGRMMHGMLAVMNEFYSRNLSDEVKRKTLAKVQKGGTPGRAPLGYLNKQDGIDVRYVILDPERALLVRWAFEAYATGDWTTRQLHVELTARGLRSRPTKTRPAQELHLSNIQAMLTNRYYKGIVTYNGVEHQGIHEPLVSADIWQQVQDNLSSKATGQKQRTHHHYLKGSLFCGHCGSSLIVSHNKNRQGIVYPYFVCLGRHQKRTGCTLKARPIDVIEALVAQQYLHVRLSAKLLSQTQDALAEELHDAQALAGEERQRQELRLRQLRGEREKLLQAHYAGAVPLDLLKKEQERFSRELTAIEGLLERSAEAVGQIEATLGRAIQLADDCHEAYAEAAPAERKMMNQAVFKRLLVTERGIIGWELAEPFASLLSEETSGFLLALNAAQMAAAAEEATSSTGAAQRQRKHQGCSQPYQRQRPSWWAGTSLVTSLKETVLVGAVGLEPTTASL